MNYFGITMTNGRVNLGTPISVHLSMDEDAPAHGLTAVFPYADWDALWRWQVYDDLGTLIFGGIIDQQQAVLSAEGMVWKLTGRSLAALLLDNEAEPKTYENPSLPILFQAYGAAHGLQGYLGDTATYLWTYVVGKGRSAWQVFADFSLYCMDVVPKVTPEGILDVTGTVPGGTLLFSNQGGISYTEMRWIRSPCKQLSQLFLQDTLGSGYTKQIVDQQAVRNGVERIRYLTVANWQGKRKLQLARRNSDSIVLTCPGTLRGTLGMRASVQDPILGKKDRYSIAKLDYYVDTSRGERCVVTLRTDG